MGAISTELPQVWRLRERRGRRRVDVRRISNVQGQEFDVVIVCTVASHRMDASLQSSFGFLNQGAMLNVALTRARGCVIVAWAYALLSDRRPESLDGPQQSSTAPQPRGFRSWDFRDFRLLPCSCPAVAALRPVCSLPFSCSGHLGSLSRTAFSLFRV